MLTAEEARKEPGVYKYVRLSNDEFRFVPLLAKVDHKELVAPGETATGAGTILIAPGRFKYVNYGSFSLDMGPSDDMDLLTTTLGLPGQHLERSFR